MTAVVFFADAATGSVAAPSGLPEEGVTSGTNALEAARTAGQLIADTAGHAASQTGPLPPESLFSWSGYFQAIGFMALLMIVLWAGLWAVRRYGKFRFLPIPGAFPRDALRMEAQLPLGPKKGLMVVRFLDRRLLLGVTEQRITLLKEIGLHDDRERKESRGESGKDAQDFERLLHDDAPTDSPAAHEARTTASCV